MYIREIIFFRFTSCILFFHLISCEGVHRFHVLRFITHVNTLMVLYNNIRKISPCEFM